MCVALSIEACTIVGQPTVPSAMEDIAYADTTPKNEDQEVQTNIVHNICRCGSSTIDFHSSPSRNGQVLPSSHEDNSALGPQATNRRSCHQVGPSRSKHRPGTTASGRLPARVSWAAARSARCVRAPDGGRAGDGSGKYCWPGRGATWGEGGNTAKASLSIPIRTDCTPTFSAQTYAPALKHKRTRCAAYLANLSIRSAGCGSDAHTSAVLCGPAR